MEATIRRETEPQIHGFETTTRCDEGLADAGKKRNGESIRLRVQNALDRAKTLCQQLEVKTIEKAKAADRTVRAHPYQTVGVAVGLGVGLGVMIGLLAMRNRRHQG